MYMSVCLSVCLSVTTTLYLSSTKRPPRSPSVLLSGPPGVGKRTVVRAVARRYRMNILEVSDSLLSFSHSFSLSFSHSLFHLSFVASPPAELL